MFLDDTRQFLLMHLILETGEKAYDWWLLILETGEKAYTVKLTG